MEVKVKETKKEFKPFIIEVKFETQYEVYDMIHLLSATNIEIKCDRIGDIDNEVFPNFRPLRDKLTNLIKQ